MLITSVPQQCVVNGSNAQRQVVHQSIWNHIKASLQLHSQSVEHLEININQEEGSGREECNLSEWKWIQLQYSFPKFLNLLHL